MGAGGQGKGHRPLTKQTQTFSVFGHGGQLNKILQVSLTYDPAISTLHKLNRFTPRTPYSMASFVTASREFARLASRPLRYNGAARGKLNEPALTELPPSKAQLIIK